MRGNTCHLCPSRTPRPWLFCWERKKMRIRSKRQICFLFLNYDCIVDSPGVLPRCNTGKRTGLLDIYDKKGNISREKWHGQCHGGVRRSIMQLIFIPTHCVPVTVFISGNVLCSFPNTSISASHKKQTEESAGGRYAAISIHRPISSPRGSFLCFQKQERSTWGTKEPTRN